MSRNEGDKNCFAILVLVVCSLAFSGLTRADTAWLERQKLLASDGAAEDGFGCSVSISGGLAIVGALRGDGNVNDSGSAYIFKGCPIADLNGDCRVDFVDFAIMAGQWLQDWN